MTREISNLEQLLDRIVKPPDDQGKVTLGKIVEAVGGRTFAPALLLAGVIMASPLSGVPTVPTTTGIMVFLIGVQLLFRRQHLWLPRWLLKRSVEKEKIEKTARWLRPPARLVDRWIHPRLQPLTQGASTSIIAITCVAIGVCAPLMEFIPFSIHGAGIAVTAFGLSMIGRDGLLALIAFIVTSIILGMAVYNLLEWP